MTDIPNSISLESRVDLFVTLCTPVGPRTTVLPNLEREFAASFAAVIRQAGHMAEYITSRGGKTMAAHMKALKRKQPKLVSVTPANVVSLKSSKGNGP